VQRSAVVFVRRIVQLSTRFYLFAAGLAVPVAAPGDLRKFASICCPGQTRNPTYLAFRLALAVGLML
jgi:hypothetical protein